MGVSTPAVTIPMYAKTGGGFASFLAPTAPTLLTASVISSSQIDITWADNSSNESSFVVQRNGVDIATLIAGTTSYSYTGLSASTAYTLSVKSVNAAGTATSGTLSRTTLSSSGALSLKFQDTFETGDLSHVENGIRYGAGANTAVSTQNSNGGTRSLRFSFIPASSTAEQRIDLGAVYQEWMATFDLYIPNGAESYGGAAYTHGVLNPANNKMFRLWRGNKLADPVNDPDGYGNYYSKYGASFERGTTSGGMSQSNISAEYGWNSTGMGTAGSDGNGVVAGSANNAIALADRGTWLSMELYCKAATVANNDGVIRVKKNGVTIINSTNLPVYPTSGAGNTGFDFCYLLGFANAGFASTMYLFIDNLKIYAQ